MKILLLVLIWFLSAFSLANSNGRDGGNGGGVQFCPEGNEKVGYSFYDGHEIKNHLIEERRRKEDIKKDDKIDGQTSKDSYFMAMVEKIRKESPALATQVTQGYLKYNTPGYVKDKGNLELAIVNDVQLFSIDSGCKYLQLVNWIDAAENEEAFGVKKQIILRDNFIYNQLSPLDQARSDFHEIVYAIARHYELIGDKGSSFVRLVVGQASTNGNIDSDLFAKISYFNRAIDFKFNSDYELILPTVSCQENPKIIISVKGKNKFKVVDNNATDFLEKYHPKVAEFNRRRPIRDKLLLKFFSNEPRIFSGNQFWDYVNNNGKLHNFEVTGGLYGYRKVVLGVSISLCDALFEKHYELNDNINDGELKIGFKVWTPFF